MRPTGATAMRFRALRAANERAAREGVKVFTYRERCDGNDTWHIRSEAEGPPPAHPRATVTVEYETQDE